MPHASDGRSTFAANVERHPGDAGRAAARQDGRIGRRRAYARAVLRLMGLPATSRCPRVTVRRRATAIELRFSGPSCGEGFDVDAHMLGADADLEAEELALLAELQRRGYRAERLQPDERRS